MSNIQGLDKQIISHGGDACLETVVAERRAQIEASHESSLVLSKEETLELLEACTQFELGRFLLKNQGLNAYWTAYAILQGHHLPLVHPLEKFLLHEAPILLATRERFKIFEAQLLEHLKADMHIADVPGGRMDNLLRAATASQLKGLCLTNIDLDPAGLQLAKDNLKNYSFKGDIILRQENAWEMEDENVFDILLSNGLTIYEPDPIKVQSLYQKFYRSLKPGGYLITSFLTPPSMAHPDSPWCVDDPLALKKQTALFKDVIRPKFQAFRTQAETENSLASVGFQDIKFIYDHQKLFPTVIARK